MEKNIYTSKTRIALVIVLAVVLTVSAGLGIYFSIAPSSLAFAASERYTLISDMPSNKSDGAAFTVDGTSVSGNSSSITKYIADGGNVVVRANIVNIGGMFGNFPVATLYSSTSSSTNFSRVQYGSFTITSPGTYYFATIVDCYDTAAHTAITKSYRSTNVLTVNVKSTDLPVAPNKTGYTFTGWYTDEECTQLYDKETITSDVTLYAGFRPNNYTIVFHGNGNTSGSMSNLAMTYDVSKHLSANAFIKTGYRFAGWSTSASGSVVHADSASVKNLSAVDGATVDLYAQWTQADYYIHFNGNGNTGGSMSNQTLTRDIAATLTSNGFVKTGYHFTGWATSADGAVVYTNGKSVTNIGTAGTTVELYAVWAVNTFTIRFHGNLDGVSGSMSNQTVTYGQTTSLKTNAFSKAGRTFLGWATSANGAVVYSNAADITNLTTENGKTIDLYAVWEVVRCKVTFMVDNEVFVVVTVDYGTPTDEVVGQAVDPAVYTVSGELPN